MQSTGYAAYWQKEREMPYILSWYLENRILLNRVSGVVAIDDFREVHQFNLEQLKVGTAPIHIIIDTTRVEQFDLSLVEFQQVLGRPTEPTMGWLVLVGNDTMARFLAAITTQFLKTQGRMFSTMGEALAFLQAVDLSLPQPKVSPGE